MIFEVLFGGRVHFVTLDAGCVPDKATQRSMARAGYRIRKDGKDVTPDVGPVFPRR